jgi:hypothetical protein
MLEGPLPDECFGISVMGSQAAFHERTTTMNNAIKAAIAATALMIGSSSLMAAPVRHYRDAQVQPIYPQSKADLPAKQFFEQLQRDSD